MLTKPVSIDMYKGIMSKTDRLLTLMQLIRTLLAPITAEQLADELGTSLRTIYRYIDDLRAAGAVIDGEAGFGYTVIEDPSLPPMMFDTDEIEALVLGLKEVIQIGDPVLAKAAKNVLSKVSASLPDRLKRQLNHSVLHAKSFRPRIKITCDVAVLRKATRDEIAVKIFYGDAEARKTERTILPLSIVSVDQKLMLLAHCTLRNDFRAFRVDRILRLSISNTSFAPRRVGMLRTYLALLNKEAYKAGR